MTFRKHIFTKTVGKIKKKLVFINYDVNVFSKTTQPHMHGVPEFVPGGNEHPNEDEAKNEWSYTSDPRT